jgi:hypothetical protein
MTRLLLVVACLVLFALGLWGMRVGWRHRAARQGDLSAPPVAPNKLGDALLAPMTGLYVGTAMARSWQDRVVAGGLGARANSVARLYSKGMVIDRDGAAPIFLPAGSIIDVRLAPGLAGKVIGVGGLLVVRWRLGDDELDTGIRADDKTVYSDWVNAMKGWVAA